MIRSSSDILIIGAGIIGLATAYHLLHLFPHLKVTLLEKEARIAAHQSTRNSGVIHSGVYYKPGSLKAQNCTRGRSLLLEFCKTHEIRIEKLGKVIVATSEKELPNLYELERRGKGNGVPCSLIDPEQLKEIEPHVQGIKALWVPSCFSINFGDVAQKLLNEIQQNGGGLHLGEQVIHLESRAGQVYVETTQGLHTASFLINCAGLHSDRIASFILGKQNVPFQIVPFRGEYWEVIPEKKHLVQGLIYPVPDPKFPFLGVHLSKMVDGRVTAGPNAVLALAREGYHKKNLNFQDTLELMRYPGFWKMTSRFWNVGIAETYRSLSKKSFLKAVRRLVPAMEESDLIPSPAGVRAQAVKPDGSLLDDFAFLQKDNTLHVLNAPSPAATSCLSIARTISEQVMSSFPAMNLAKPS